MRTARIDGSLPEVARKRPSNVRFAGIGKKTTSNPVGCGRYTWPVVFDTHCHLTFDCFEGRVEEVLQEAAKAGVRGCITVATTTADAPRVTALADQHPRVWCSTGVHPLYSDQPIDWAAMHTAAQHPRCVAWGELGLDNHYAQPPAAKQRETLETQLAHIEGWTSEGLAKPVVCAEPPRGGRHAALGKCECG